MATFTKIDKTLEKELQKQYIRNKIILNPVHYNLKDRVLLTKDVQNVSIWNTDLSFYDKIMTAISEKYPISHAFLPAHPEYINITPVKETSSFLNDVSLSILVNDNIYIDYNKMLYDLTLDVKDAENHQIFTGAIINFGVQNIKYYLAGIVFLKLPTSLLDICNYMTTALPTSYTAEDIKEMRYLNDNLEDLRKGKTSNLYLYSLLDSAVPRYITMDLGTPRKHNTQRPARLTTDKPLIDKMYATSMIYAIELFSNIYHSRLNDIEKEEYINKLVEIENSDNLSKMVFGRYIFDYSKYEFYSDIKYIIDTEDMNERFSKLYKIHNEFIEKLKTEKYMVTDHSHGEEYFPRILATLIQTAKEYSERCQINKTIVKLLEFCKLEDIDISPDVVSGGGSALGIGLSDIESKPSLVNDTFVNYDKDTSAPELSDELKDKEKEKVKNSRITNEMLDKAYSNFKEKQYDFDVSYVKSEPSGVSESCKATYNNLVMATRLINRTLIKAIKEIKTYNVGGKNPGLSKGRLDPKRLYQYKTNPNIFCNNTYKIRESDLAIGVILDTSGSMYGEGIENGRITMIVLHETLKALGINHCIITHNSRGMHQSTIKKYQPFQEDRNYNISRCYELAKITANGGNCDSGALYYMEKELSRVKNKDKICIMFSDGEPTECTDEELKQQVTRMEKRGIRVIGVGINFESIKEYYPHNANGKNLKQMLDIVTDILKEYILEKAEK